MRKVISSDGTPIVYDRVGDGSVILVVNGAFGDRATDAGLAALLAPAFTVYTYDRRGRGGSGEVEPFAPEREFEDIEALITESGGSVCLYGNSAGGIVGLEAVARGLAISKLAVWEPPFVVAGSRPPLPADYRERLETMYSQGRRRDMLELFMSEAALLAEREIDSMRKTSQWSRMEESAHTLVYDARLGGDFSLPAKRLTRVTVPTLVLDGGTAGWLTAAAEAMAAVLPRGCRRTLAHQPHQVSAEAMASALADFFATD